MDMTAAQSGSEFDRYGDEVLNANWLPQAVLQSLQTSPGAQHARQASIGDPEAFMRRLYQAQE